MTRRRGFVSPARAAKILGLHRNTTYAWARDAAAGDDSRFSDVERHPITGYLEIPIEEVERIKDPDDE